jgi:hypothetical protein
MVCQLTKNGIRWIHGHLVLGWVTNETLCVCEGHIAWCCSVSLDYSINVVVVLGERKAESEFLS